MKKYMLSIFLLALPILASAYDCQVDGIYYNLISKGNVAEVTRGETRYSGSVVIPDRFTYEGVEYSVTAIGERAFQKCVDLTAVTIPNFVTSIGFDAFWGCTSLTTVTIPNSVTEIGGEAFYGCSSLTSVTIPNSVNRIGDIAFCNCTSLTSVTFPNSVTSLGMGVFSKCTGLISVTIPNTVADIGDSTFSGCTSLTSVIIPNSVTSIRNFAFSNCSNLVSVTIPNSVTYIGQGSFNGCSNLTSVTIPHSVASVGYQAFAKCGKLEDVYCYAESVPQTEINAFEKSYPEYATLYVPAESLNDYKTTEPWSQFGTIKPISGSGDEPTKCATPTISYESKRLTFSCETEDVEYVSEIKDVDIKKYYDATIDLTATYEISVYATKSGYENSDIATATLVWTDAIFTETTEPATSAKAVTESIPVLISAQGGTVTVRCEQEGQPVAVYTADGKALGNSIVSGGHSTIATPLQKGQVAIVNVGNKSVKIIMK